MANKRLIIVGNKPSNNTAYKDFINESDIVVRISKMENYGISGTKTDIVHCECNDHYRANVPNNILEITKNCNYITYMFNENADKPRYSYLINVINIKNKTAINLADPEIHQHVFDDITPNDDHNNKWIFSTIRVLNYIMHNEEFASYDKYLIFYDLDRHKRENENINSYHSFEKEETDYLNKLIKEKQIYYINVDEQ